MTTALVAILAYVLVQFVIALVIARRMASTADYILAGRSLGVGLVTFAVFATFFGSEALIATGGSVYADGWAGAAIDPFGYGVALLISGAVFAGALWRRDLTTFADLFRQRYGAGVERLVVVMLVPGSLFWAAAQIRGFGQLLAANSTLDVGTAITVAALIVTTYTVVGGLLADSIGDVIHGAVVIGGLLLLTVLVATVPPVADTASAGAAAAAVPVAGATAAEPGGWLTLAFVESLLIPICGTVVAVEIISRYLGARSARVAALGTVLGGVLYIVVGLCPIYLGLAGRTLLPGLDEAEQVVPKLAEMVLPGPLHVVFVGAIVAAILSTVHATIHGPGAQISHNLVDRMAPGLSDRQRLWSARTAVFALALVASGLSLTGDGVKELVATASAFGSAGVFVVAVFALFTGFGGRIAAYGALIVGMGVWLVAHYALAYETPYMLALGTALAVYVVAGAVERVLGVDVVRATTT
jgi:Na+/proline symporter